MSWLEQVSYYFPHHLAVIYKTQLIYYIFMEIAMLIGISNLNGKIKRSWRNWAFYLIRFDFIAPIGY